jgi:NADH-quinone oxidoreductase subunit A
MILSQDTLGALLFGAMVVLNFGGMLVGAHLVGRLARRPWAASKGEPFECGYPVSAPLPSRLSVKYYVAGLLLLVFDVETVFLYLWAVEFRALGVFGLVEMGVFVGLLFVGYVYLLRRGAFRWS